MMVVEYGDEIDVVHIRFDRSQNVIVEQKRVRPNRKTWKKKIIGDYKGELEAGSLMQLWPGHSAMWNANRKIQLPSWKLIHDGVELDFTIRDDAYIYKLFASQPASCQIPIVELVQAFNFCQPAGTPPAPRRSARI